VAFRAEYAQIDDMSILSVVSRRLFTRVSPAPVPYRDVQHDTDDGNCRHKRRAGQEQPVVSQVVHMRIGHGRHILALRAMVMPARVAGAGRIAIFRVFHAPQANLVWAAARHMA
jgi:hypothetical protein